jgi:hypothetical protein
MAAVGPVCPTLTAKLYRQPRWWAAYFVAYADSPDKKPSAQNVAVDTLWRSRSDPIKTILYSMMCKFLEQNIKYVVFGLSKNDKSKFSRP